MIFVEPFNEYNINFIDLSYFKSTIKKSQNSNTPFIIYKSHIHI